MSANLDDACTDYKDALALQAVAIAVGTEENQAQAKRVLMRASQDYAQALVDDAQRKLDAMGVVIGETVVVDKGTPLHLSVVKEIRGNVYAGFAQCILKPVHQDLEEKGWAQVENLIVHVAPVVKEMVLFRAQGSNWTERQYGIDTHITVLSNVTPTDLDAMKPGDVIEGSYKIERMK